MKQLYTRLWLTLAFLSLAAPLAAQSDTTAHVFGRVLDEAGEPLVGVYVILDGTKLGTITNAKGAFDLRVPDKEQVKLRAKLVGYKDKTIKATPGGQEVTIEMKEQIMQTDEVVISASRMEENIMRSPVTISTMSLLEIRENPSISAYDAMASMKGVDRMSVSLINKSYNTRGFNSANNSRFIQRIDGVDMQTPGLNAPNGLLTGAIDLDIAKMELIPGASSALYGPNAFNGLLNIQTKDPFQYPGLSVSVKSGANHLNSPQVDPQPFNQVSVRYAKPITRRFGVKVNAEVIRGEDWYANNFNDQANYSGTVNLEEFDRGPGNPGFDGVNTYGDAVSTVIDSSFFPNSFYNLTELFSNLGVDTIEFDPTRVARTGYREADLVDYDTYSARADIGLYYRFTNNLQLEWQSRFSQGSSVLQADSRISMNNLRLHNHKLELSGDRFFVRAYGTIENSGDSFDSRLTAINLNREVKADDQWFTQYLAAYFGLIKAFASPELDWIDPKFVPKPGNEADARRFADGDNRDLNGQFEAFGNNNPVFSDLVEGLGSRMGGRARLEPGTEEFEEAREEIINSTDWANGGSKFFDNSQLYNLDVQYDFSHIVPWFDVIAGGNFRLFRLDSDGLVFADSAGPLDVSQAGGYVQATRKWFNDRLKLMVSGRIDKADNLESRVSPRAAVVYSLGRKRQHNLRASIQTGFKLPDLRAGYADINLGAVRSIGGFGSFFDRYGLLIEQNNQEVSNAFTLESVQQFRETGDAKVLERLPMTEIESEFVRSIEAGYKGAISRGVMLDVNAYFNEYENFIGGVNFIGPKPGDVGTADQELTEAELLDGEGQRFIRQQNSTKQIQTWGAAGGLTVFLSRNYILRGNYSYNTIRTDSNEIGGFRTRFNTPPHKFNIGLTGRKLLFGDRFGFNVNLRWVDSFFFQLGLGEGTLPSFTQLDAKVSYKLPKLQSRISLGGTNLLNDRHREIFGGPTLGTLVYVQFTYDGFLN